jgi:hypothetical protein
MHLENAHQFVRAGVEQRQDEEVSERPMGSLMVACEIAHAGSPCVTLIKIKYEYYFHSFLFILASLFLN